MALRDLLGLISGYGDALQIDWTARFDGFFERLTTSGAPPQTLDADRALSHLCDIAYLAHHRRDADVVAALADGGRPLGDLRTLCGVQDADGQRRAVAVTGGDNVVIAIRGSANLRDWAYNLASELVGTPRLHAGFTRISDELWPWVASVARGRRTAQSITITGHSLGGAAAVLLGHRLAVSAGSSDQPVRVVTFGAPKVGTADFAPQCPVTGYRMLGDMIPELTAGAGYAVHGDGYLLTPPDGVRPAPDTPRTALLTWVRAASAVGEQAVRLLSAGTFCGDDLLPVYLYSQPYLVVVDATSTLADIFGRMHPDLHQILAAARAFMRDPRTPGLKMSVSVGAPQLARVGLIALDAELRSTLERLDGIIHHAARLVPQIWTQGIALVLLGTEHHMDRYRDHLDRLAG